MNIHYDILDVKNTLYQYLFLIIANKVCKHDIFRNQINNLVTKYLYNIILSIIIGYVFYNLTEKYFDEKELTDIKGLFICYWSSINITDYFNQIRNEQDEILTMFKDIVLNFIIFTGLATIFNIFK